MEKLHKEQMHELKKLHFEEVDDLKKEHKEELSQLTVSLPIVTHLPTAALSHNGCLDKLTGAVCILSACINPLNAG